jgi:hypothetical protein
MPVAEHKSHHCKEDDLVVSHPPPHRTIPSVSDNGLPLPSKVCLEVTPFLPQPPHTKQKVLLRAVLKIIILVVANNGSAAYKDVREILAAGL